jgi:hypothetical protein
VKTDKIEVRGGASDDVTKIRNVFHNQDTNMSGLQVGA